MGDQHPASAAGDLPSGRRGMIAARFASLIAAGQHASIVRRAVVLMVFVSPAFLANLLVYFLTARILSPENFGLFYVAITIGNIAYSGSLVLNIFFTRYLVQIGATHAGDVVAATRSIQRMFGFWGAVLSLLAFALLALFSEPLGVRSLPVVLLIVIDTYASYLGDLARAYFQSRRQTWQLGTYTFLWMVLRLALCVLGAALFGTVWAALLGSALAAALAVAGFQPVLAHAAGGAREPARRLPAFANLIPTILGYGLLMVISNLDILAIWFLLPGSDIGIYSASSVFPKGILMATMPVSQLLFAVLLGDRESQDTFRTTVRKTIWVITALTAGAAIAVWVASPWLCGGSFGLELCAPAPLHVLLVSAVLLSVLRMTVLLEFVRQRDWLILTLLLPTAVYLAVAAVTRPELDGMAMQFTIFAGASLVFFTAVQWGAAWWRSAGPQP